jgi:hypothetical protein
MDAVTATARMTAAEFLALPWEHTRWQQLIDGEIVVNDPTRTHNGSQGCIFAALRGWAVPGRGWVALPLDVAIDERSVCKPPWRGTATPGLPAERIRAPTGCRTSRWRSGRRRRGALTSVARRSARA